MGIMPSVVTAGGHYAENQICSDRVAATIQKQL